MSNIKSQYKGGVISECKATDIKSTTQSDVQSKTNVKVVSDIEAAKEREAFLTTAKRNAAIMFAKYL